MLVLTRKQSDTIHIGDDVVIKVIQTGRGSIKLGIAAPPAIRVRRGEVADDGVGQSATAQPSSRIAPPSRPDGRPAKFHVAK